MADAAGGTGAAAASADQMPIFEYDPTWPQMPLPDDWVLGNVVGVDVDHDDNVWIGNSGATNDAHILKFSRTGEFLMMVGRLGRGDGSNDTTALGKPTGIVVDPDTNELFVADGYANRRVIVFDADTGEYKRHCGAYGNPPDDGVRERYVPGGPPPSQFRTPHGLNLSHDGLVYLADRGNCRIQVFERDGTFVDEVVVAPNTPQGSAFDVAFSADAEQQFLYMLNGHSNKVRILRRCDLTHLGDFGYGGRFAGGLTTPHNLAVDSHGNLYVTESGEGKRVQRFLYRGLGPSTLP